MNIFILEFNEMLYEKYNIHVNINNNIAINIEIQLYMVYNMY